LGNVTSVIFNLAQKKTCRKKKVPKRRGVMKGKNGTYRGPQGNRGLPKDGQQRSREKNHKQRKKVSGNRIKTSTANVQGEKGTSWKTTKIRRMFKMRKEDENERNKELLNTYMQRGNIKKKNLGKKNFDGEFQK